MKAPLILRTLALLLFRRKGKAPSTPLPSASSTGHRGDTNYRSAAIGGASADPIQKDQRPGLPSLPAETTAPRNRRHIPLEEIIDRQFRAKWFLEYNHSLLFARPEDLSPLDVAYLQRRGDGQPVQGLGHTPRPTAAAPSSSVSGRQTSSGGSTDRLLSREGGIPFEDFAIPGPLNQARPEDLAHAFRTATAHLPQPPAPKVPDCMFMARIRRDEEDARITLSH